MTAFCADRPHCLTTREQDFIRELPNWTSGGPTWKMYKWLVKILERLTNSADDATAQRVRQALK